MAEIKQSGSRRQQCWICGRTESEVDNELPSEFFEDVGAVSISLKPVDALCLDMPVCVICRELFRSMGEPDYGPSEDGIDYPRLPEDSADSHASADALALKYAQAAARQLEVISTDLLRYTQSLNTPVMLRTADQQSNISLGDLELLMQTLQKMGHSLLKMREAAQERMQKQREERELAVRGLEAD